MQAERVASVQQFLEESLELRAREPLRTNVLGSVAGSIAAGRPWQGECFWWIVRDGAAVVGAAMRTSPFSLSLSPMSDEALDALAAAVLHVDGALPGVAGCEHQVDAFLAASGARGGPGPGAVARRLPQLLYEAPTVRLPDVEGTFGYATGADVGVLVAWSNAFEVEAEGMPASDEERLARTLDAVRDRRSSLWRIAGEPVSMAGHAIAVDTPSGTVTRVGPVYTPPALRRRGYAGAVTGALTADILATGSRAILYTDARNPTSNHVYQDLGYELVDRYAHVHLASR